MLNLKTNRLVVLVLAIAQLAVIILGVFTGANNSFDSRPIDEAWIVPAEYAFAIWGYIYPASIVYAIIQALPRYRDSKFFDQLSWWTSAAYASMTVWALAAQNNVGWATVVLIFAILVSLLGAYRICFSQVKPSWLEKLGVILPISVHAGWITVASIANTASFLKEQNFEFFLSNEFFWTVTMLVVAAMIVCYVAWMSGGEPGYILAVYWALFAIGEVNRVVSIEISRLAYILAAVIILAMVAGWYKAGKKLNL